MEWFKKAKKGLKGGDKKNFPEDLWMKCPKCNEFIFKKELPHFHWVCPACTYHIRIGSKNYISILVDEGTFEEFNQNIVPLDPLEFEDTKKYKDRLVASHKKTGLKDAAVTGLAKIGDYDVVLTLLDFGFMGGSMGSVVGEKITRAVEKAIELRCPMLILSSSGGARMQEGILSLMQMAKTSAALSLLHREGLLYISILTHPTTGGVTASFASLGDINIAEPEALIGFAGPRVIEQTIRQDLPEGFQRSEFLLEHGMIDIIVDRRKLKETLIKFLKFFLAEIPKK